MESTLHLRTRAGVRNARGEGWSRDFDSPTIVAQTKLGDRVQTKHGGSRLTLSGRHDISLLNMAMKMREIMDIITESSNTLYHVSSDPNLVINPDHELSGGQLGRGFYVTAQPHVWQSDQLPGKRKYIYKVNTAPLKIATSADLHPDKVVEWAVAKGYYKMGPEIHPRTGEPILSYPDNKPMVRPQVTDLGKPFFQYQDPITGDRSAGLNNAYLLDHGFNAYEAKYSPDGHQVIILDPTVIRLTKVKSVRR